MHSAAQPTWPMELLARSGSAAPGLGQECHFRVRNIVKQRDAARLPAGGVHNHQRERMQRYGLSSGKRDQEAQRTLGVLFEGFYDVQVSRVGRPAEVLEVSGTTLGKCDDRRGRSDAQLFEVV